MLRPALFLIAALACTLTACAGGPSKEDGPMDLDQDGYGWAVDCDELNGEINPGASELCDGIDNNCDGLTDDDSALDVPTWYADADGDDYGSPEYARLSCEAPVGYVDNSLDCNDKSSRDFPGAEERCDGVDDDCNGVIDDNTTDGSTFFFDADDDGYGDGELPVEACEAPAGYTNRAGDCDETDETVNPGVDETWYDGVDQDCDGKSDYDQDRDSYDAQAYGGEDCDDLQSRIKPGTTEVCNDVDEDCDGSVDEDARDAPLWFADTDRDGYGTSDSTLKSCDEPNGYADPALGDDCDDEDRLVHPDAEEIYYDGADQNCDGLSDYDADEDGYDATAWGGADCDDHDAVLYPRDWYYDGDSDGYGDATTSTASCFAPTADYVTDDRDCLDTNSLVNPLAVEVCGDGLDNDCSTDAEGCGLLGDLDASTDAWASLFGELSADKSGSAVAGVGDVTGDGVDDILIGAENGNAGASNGGAAYLLSPVAGRSLIEDGVATIMSSTSSAHAGCSLSRLGDINRDGYDDLAVGARSWDDGVNQAGAAWILLGPLEGDIILEDEPDYMFGTANNDLAAYAIAGGLDVTGDGTRDIVVGAPSTDVVNSADGAAYLFNDGWSGATPAGEADALLYGDAAGDKAGAALSMVPDLNGDGVDDLAVGSYLAGTGGVASVFFGPVSGTATLSAADLYIQSSSSGDQLGRSLAGIGDSDDDGYGDLVVGAPGHDDSASDVGVAWLFMGPLEGSRTEADAAGSVLGGRYRDQVGYSVAAAGDVDANGYADVIIGATTNSAGFVAVMVGPWSGTYTNTTLPSLINGWHTGDDFGHAVAGAGDVDDDGFDDVLVGAWTSDGSATDMGVSFLFRGGPGF